jgi:acetyltransferase EpsM
MEARPVVVPLINPNELEAVVAALHVSEGDRVTPGQPICTLETTKTADDLVAEGEGYVVGLRTVEGATVRAGEVLCYLAASASWQPPAPPPPTGATDIPQVPQGLRITEPALQLASELGVDLNRLPTGPLVTEETVGSLAGRVREAPPLAVPSFDSHAIVVYGAGGHGKSLVDLLRTLGTYRLVGFVDDGLHGSETVLGLPVLGNRDVLPGLADQGVRLAVNAVGGIGNIQARLEVFDVLAQTGFVCPPLVHPTGFLEPTATLAAGAQILPHAYVGTDARVGFGVIVNTGVIISHDCVLAQGANISPGAVLAGGVEVGPGALIGMGVTINLGVRVGAWARVGNSATVKEHVPDHGLVRAGSTWPS